MIFRILSEISNKPSSKLSISLDWFSEEVLQKLFHSKVEVNAYEHKIVPFVFLSTAILAKLCWVSLHW